MKRILVLGLAVLLVISLSACQKTSTEEIIDNNQKILEQIDDIQEKSDYISGLIDDYNNG